MKVIDMQHPKVRNAILLGKDSAIDLYHSDLAVDYDDAGFHGRPPAEPTNG